MRLRLSLYLPPTLIPQFSLRGMDYPLPSLATSHFPSVRGMKRYRIRSVLVQLNGNC